MYKIIKQFEKEVGVPPPKNFYKTTTGVNIPIYIIDSFHVLTQFVGYAKYANQNSGNVFLRGQSQLFGPKLVPSALRNVEFPQKKMSRYQGFIKESSRMARDLEGMENNKLHPLLQHYGIKTAWLDIVDNLWVALWFGLHDTSSIIINEHEHIHIFEQTSGYAYIFLILADAINEENPGIYKGVKTIVTDLRKACPSFFIRPHAQHGLMIKKTDGIPDDYSDLIIGIAAVQVENGFGWIGHDGLLSIQSLFPPTKYDYGYRLLLEQYKSHSTRDSFIEKYGSIHLVSH